MKDFIGRIKELSQLEKAYSNGSDLILITGRRRIGKTRLIQEFIRDKDAIYFLATNVNERDLMDDMWECVKPRLDNALGRPSGWKEVFSSIVSSGCRILVIDEFSYMARLDNGFLVRFQGIFDSILKGSGIMTILCGSHMSVMNNLSEDADSPLYGRFDRRMVLWPLAFHEIARTGDAWHDIEMYSVHGGIPRYMELMTEDTVKENVTENIMDPRSMMFNDPIAMLERDVGGSGTYLSLVKAIANGNHRLSEISSAMEMQSGALGPYLNRLMEIGLVRKEVPITETNPDKSKKGRYYIADNFTAFWFRFVYPYRSELMRDVTSYAIKRFDTDFIQRHASFVFEDICRESVRRKDVIGFIPERVGRYWDGNMEMDIVAIDSGSKRAFVGECKYSRSPMVRHDLQSLKGKAERVPDLRDYDITYGLFSMSGFEGIPDDPDVLLFDRDSIIGD